VRILLLAALTACSFQHGAPADPAAADGAIDAPDLDGEGPAPEGPQQIVDIIIEAEDYTSNVVRAPFSWTPNAMVIGHSGATYMTLLPDNGTPCTAAVETTCSELQYSISIVQTATYHVHARMFATDSANDSVWYGLDGTAVTNAFQPPHDSTWQWVNGPAVTIPAGNHTLSFWYRETGVIVDVVAVTTSATAPP
jgi:hypothetical protein